MLVSIIRDSKSTVEMLSLAMKILLRIGITRRNAEDFLIISRLIDENPSLAQKVDLRQEFKELPLVGGGATVATPVE